MSEAKQNTFAVFAEAEGYEKPLIMLDLLSRFRRALHVQAGLAPRVCCHAPARLPALPVPAFLK